MANRTWLNAQVNVSFYCTASDKIKPIVKELRRNRCWKLDGRIFSNIAAAYGLGYFIIVILKTSIAKSFIICAIKRAEMLTVPTS